MSEEEIILEPDPSRVMEGLRDTGYDFNMAMADIIDNSIAANASVINVYINTLPDNEVKIYIADNGCGMNMDELKNAMRYGSSRRTNVHSLGKFGLGLKTASTAFCRSLSVLSKGSYGIINKVQWDLDEICKINKWKLLLPSISDDEIELLENAAGEGTGTLIIWEKIDRLLKDYQREGAKQNAIRKIMEGLKFHFSMVYQRFLDSKYTTTPIQIYLNDERIEPWDPFCQDENDSTVTGKTKVKVITPEGIPASFSLTAYVLPRKENFSTLTAYNRAHVNNDMQGFYIYRENRLIHHGDWGGIRRKDPHFSLARVDISFDSQLDEAFNVDIKKSRIAINEDISDYLEKEFLPPTIRESENRYRKLQKSKVSSASNGIHDAAGINIDTHASELEESDLKIVDKEKDKVEVTNKEGKFTTTIKILEPQHGKQQRVQLVDSIENGLLWEPAIVEEQHAVSINKGHDFYLKIYGSNLDNPSVIQGIDSLLWGLAEAELSTYNSKTKDQYEEMRIQVSRILKRLVNDLPDPIDIEV